MEDTFKINVDQLMKGDEKIFKEILDPSFLEIDETDLAFRKEIVLEGVAYIAEEELLLRLNVQTEALVVCSVCNEFVPIPILLEDEYYSEPLNEIKTGIFNFKELLRESILLEVPPFAECCEGNCPKRGEIQKYLKTSTGGSSHEDEGYTPFADLEWETK